MSAVTPTVADVPRPDGADPAASSSAPGTTAGPTPRSVLRRARVPLLLAALLVLALVAVALLGRAAPARRLDPDSYAPAGGRALATLLRDRGVAVQRVTTVEQALQGGPGTTLLVPVPAELPGDVLARLTARPGPLVVLGADQAEVDALRLPVEVDGPFPVEPRRPACTLPPALLAGDAETGGFGYRARSGEAVGCYATGGRPTLLQLPGSRLLLLGSGAALTNARLAERGDAALALGLLASGDEVRWLVPSLARTTSDAGSRSVGELLPPWVPLGGLQLVVAAAVLALWRARRLGRVVPEPLPVVVRSAESVEGRARLYRASRSRGRAAGTLRGATSRRLVRRLGLVPGTRPEALAEAVAARTGDDPAAVAALLTGPPPGSDDALVRLAADLDGLAEQVVRGRRAADGDRDGTPPAAEGGSTT